MAWALHSGLYVLLCLSGTGVYPRKCDTSLPSTEDLSILKKNENKNKNMQSATSKWVNGPHEPINKDLIIASENKKHFKDGALHG